MNKLNKPKKVSFCGISGSGMSSLAQLLKLSGYDVRGSDRSFDSNKDIHNRQALEEIGIKIYPQDGSGITDDLDTVYCSTAVEDSIPDIKVAKEKNISIKTRPQLLSEILNNYKTTVAVGGTSGKTTVTAMVGYILDKAGKKPCMINGGLLRDYEQNKGIPNIIYNNGDICVAEADESNGSIDLYSPTVSVINNISEDHKTLDELLELFNNLTKRTSQAVITSYDCPLCQKLNGCKNIKTFSVKNPNADYYASDISALTNGTQYTLDNKVYTLKLIGAFNVANALAAIGACVELGVDKHLAAEILQNFSGTKRRLEIIGTKNDITVIDDFAHNSAKIAASLSALRQYSGRLIVVFQPHGFGPMRSYGKDMVKEFVKGLNKDDIFIMSEIFYAGGTVTKDISSADFIKYAQELGKENSFFAEDKTQAAEMVLAKAQAHDRVVIMGARDNSLTELCKEILKRIEHA